MNLEDVKPYTFNDFLTMKPGTFLGGFVKDSDLRLASKWSLPPGLAKRPVIPIVGITEHGSNWRQKFRASSHMVGTTRLYKPILKEPSQATSEEKAKGTMTLFLPTDCPVGIYLGHMIRTDDLYYVNVLTGEGYDVWIRCV